MITLAIVAIEADQLEAAGPELELEIAADLVIVVAVVRRVEIKPVDPAGNGALLAVERILVRLLILGVQMRLPSS